MWFGRNKEPEVQVPEYFAHQEGAEQHISEPDAQSPYVEHLPVELRMGDGRDFRVFWPTGDIIDVNHAELAQLGKLDLRQIAQDKGYEMPSDMARLDELADAHAGRFTGQNNAGAANQIELSIDKLSVEGLTFKGDPRALIGGQQPASSPLEQLMLTYLANRGQQAPHNQFGGYAPEVPPQQAYWNSPPAGFEDDVIDAEVAESEAANPAPLAEDLSNPSFNAPVPEAEPQPDVASERAPRTIAEIQAKRKKLVSRVSALGIAATISIGGYGTASTLLGLDEHKIWKPEALIGYNMTLIKFIGSLMS